MNFVGEGRPSWTSQSRGALNIESLAGMRVMLDLQATSSDLSADVLDTTVVDGELLSHAVL